MDNSNDDRNPRLYVGAPPSEVWIRDSLTGQRQPLELHLNLREHSPTGFSWGYGGSGPAQLAHSAILSDATGDDELALTWYQEFKWEIGIRKAMGAKRKDILFQFVTEATLLSLGGGGVGLLLGLGLIRLLNGQTLFGNQPAQMAFSGDIALLALGVSAAIGLFFGIYPAMRAARLHPIDALRYE